MALEVTRLERASRLVLSVLELLEVLLEQTLEVLQLDTLEREGEPIRSAKGASKELFG